MLTIGQHIDAIRERCAELGADVEVQIRAWELPNHETAKKVAIQVTNELGGEMSDINYPIDPNKIYRSYRVNGHGCNFLGYWDEKEKATSEQVAV